MNNPKTFKKVLVVALALAMVVGAFSMFTFGTAAEATYTNVGSTFASSPAAKLTSANGITFDDYEGTFDSNGMATGDQTRGYLRDTAGFALSGQKENTQRPGVNLIKESGTDVALRLDGNAFWINGNVGDAKDEAKYAWSSMILDLFNDPNGPKEFSLSFDMMVFGESGNLTGFAKTADNGSGAYLGTYYRGVSAFCINGYNWLFKITPVNLPAIVGTTEATVSSVNCYRVDIADEVAPEMKDKGYIYGPTQIMTIGVADGDELLTTGLGSMNQSKTPEEAGRAGSCITMEAMDMDGVDDAITYTLNEYFNVKIDVTRADDGKSITMKTYIDGKYLSTVTEQVNAASGDKSNWKFGIRLFDQSSDVQLDNIKVSAPNNDFGDLHTGHWKNVTTQLVREPGVGLAMIETCNYCNEVISKTYPSVVYDGTDSVGVNSDATNTDSVPGNPGTVNKVYHEDISTAWDTVKTAPFWMNFELKNVTKVIGNANGGASLLTWRNNGTGYCQLLRLFGNGEIRLINTRANYIPVDSDFRLKGTEAEPGNYSFHIYIDPMFGSYDVYIDDLNDDEPLFYFGSQVAYSLTSSGGSAPKVRFNDGNVGVYRMENFTLTTGVAAEDHVHSGIYSTAEDVSVVVGYDTVETGYLCYCGAPVPGGDVVNEQLVVCDNVYYGKGTVEGLPTDGEYWITTDVNVRSAEGLAAVLESGVMTLGEKVIALSEDVAVPATYQYAVKVTADGTDETKIEVYFNGKSIATETVAAFDSITLGGADTTEVRFFYTKVVALGSDEQAAVTFNDSVDPAVKPCYHAVANAKLVVDSLGNVFLRGACSKCGETVMDDSVTDYHDASASGVPFDANGKFSFNSAVFYNYKLPAEVKGTDKDPYQVMFTVTLDKMVSPASNLYNSGSGRNFMNFDSNYNSTLRVFPVSDGNGGYYADRVDLRTREGSNALIKTLYEGDVIDITLNVNPAKGSVDIYVDGVYATTNTANNPGKANTMRFGDQSECNFSISDFHIVVSKDNHVHSDAWATVEERSVVMTDNSFEYKYVCYCDETISVSGINHLYNASNVVYGGAGVNVVDNAWYAFDLNVRTEDAMANVPTLIKSGDFEVPAGELKGPATYQYAVNVKANADGTYNVYVFSGEDMTCVEYKNVVLGDLINFVEHAYDNVRLYSFRAFEIGGDVELVYEDTTDYTIRPCAHEWTSKFIPVAGETYTGNRIKAINKLVRISDCSVCGERAYSVQGDVLGVYTNYAADNGTGIQLDTTGSMIDVARGARYIAVKRTDLALGADPYWVSFDLSAEMSEAQVQNVIKKGTGGASIFAISYPMIDDGTATGLWQSNASSGSNTYMYIQMMRAYGAPDGNGGYRTDALGLNFYQGGGDNPKFIMESGKSYKIAIYVEPRLDGYFYQGYVDGVLIEERYEKSANILSHFDLNRVDAALVDEKNAVNARMFTFRFTDGNYGDMHIANLAMVKAAEDTATTHKHSPQWLNDEEKANSMFVVTKDNTVIYYYDCYCGETVVEGVKEILVDNITPAYNTTEPVVAFNNINEYIRPGTAITSSMLAKAFPEEGTKALVTVGGNVIVSVDSEGRVIVGDVAEQMELNAHYDIILYCTYSGYNIYIGGAYYGTVPYENLTDDQFVIGEEGIGLFHFDKMAIITLGEDCDLAFTEGSDGHKHQFDPYDSYLMFNEERTTITVEYICTVCDRPAIDGIVADLYDDETTDDTEAIAAVIGTPVGGATVIEDAIDYVSGKDNFWFSADFTVVEMSNKNRQNVVSLMGTKLVLIDSNGTIRLADEANTVIGEVAEGGTFNVTFNAIDNGDSIIAHVYLDGNYCGTLDIAFGDTLDIKVGDDSALVMNVDNIKLAELGNGGQRAIGAFHCEIHKYDPADVVINYLDLDTFVTTSTCVVCGHKVTERPVYNFYKAPAPIYNYGLMTMDDYNDDVTGVSGIGYWTVVDVNKRGDIAYFDGYKNVIGEAGLSFVVMDAKGNLYLGNGRAIGQYFSVIDGKTTHNIAVRVTFGAEDDYIDVYVDGKFVGSMMGDDLKYEFEFDPENEWDCYGAAELTNIKFYNIRSFISGETAPFVTFNYSKNYEEIPCGHIFDSNTMTKTAVFGEDIQIVYICQSCGERVHTTFDVNLYDASLQTDFIPDENGEVHFDNYIHLRSTADDIGSKASPYWVKFKLTVHELNVEAVSANNNNNNGGRNLLNFGSNYSSPLRLYAIKDDKGGYVDNALIVRSVNAAYGNEVARLYEGESVEFALYTDPATLFTEIYVNGEFAAVRKNAFDTKGTYFRILDGNWGEFTISELQFVTTTDIGHVHTAEYSEQLGYTPTLAYGDLTLKHTFMCTCGKLITEGVDKALAEEIKDIENITSATAIPEAAKTVVDGTPYWVSAKVYGDGSDATVYSYNDVELVGIKNGVYTICGVETNVAVSGATTAGDYDLVSINIQPTTGTVLLYINGTYVAWIHAEDFFALNESFNVKLGGGAALSFKNIKVVTLADGVNNEVNIYGCGNHSFRNSAVIPTVTDEGITYKCKFCGEKVLKTVEIGDAKVYSTSNGNINISNNSTFIGDNAEPYDVYTTLLTPEDGGSFYITFDIKPTDLSGLGTGGKSVLTWMPGTTTYRQIFRAFKIDNNSTEIWYYGSDSAYHEYTKPVVFTKNTTYKIVIESDPVNNLTHLYVNGEYVGAADFVVKGGTSAQHRLRFGDSGTGKWEVTNIKMYNAETETITKVQTDTAIPTVHSHFPDTTKAQTMNVVDGVVTHSFTCTCGEVLDLDVMNDLIPDAVKNYKGLYTFQQVFLEDRISAGGDGTFMISFDLEVNAVNVANLIDGGTNGRSIVSIGSGSIRLLRGFPVEYVDGQGYTDANGDGYADNVIELKYYNKNRSSLAIMTTGDKVNFTYVIDPDNSKILIYVDGQYVDSAHGFAKLTGEQYIRLLEKLNYGNYNFTNLVVARMTAEDTCQHEIPACTSTEYTYTCTDCNRTFERTHNYVAQGDVTGKWIKYTCEDCGTYYLAFNDMSIVADLTYANKEELMKILTDMYFPIFR